MSDMKEHWESVFKYKQPNEVSWTQTVPKTSLNFINSFSLPKTASIIDVGGGDSNLVDFLLTQGYKNITVLDISEMAIERVKLRLGERAKEVQWIVSDITEFKPEQKFDVWHDRAAFHFLTAPEQIQKYVAIAKSAVRKFMTIGTFSECGPLKCSGLDIRQYSETSLAKELAENFQKLKCITEDHITPFGTKQNFLFCNFAVMARAS